MMRKGKCTNIGNCNLADSDKIIQIPEVDDFECPECGIELNPFSKDGMWPINRRTMRRLMGATALLVFLFWGYRLFTPSKADCNKDEFICCQVGDAYETMSECDCLALNHSIKTAVLASENSPCEISDTEEAIGEDMTESLPEFNEERAARETKAAVNQFYLFIEDIANEGNEERVNDLMKMALDMFISDQVTVEISNSGNRKQVLKIKEYLSRAAEKYSRDYDNIKVEIEDFQFTSPFMRSSDSEYPEFTGKVKFQQAFIGYSLGKIKYGDDTGKGAEIIVKAERDPLTDKLRWKVYLSHIFVIEDARITI